MKYPPLLLELRLLMRAKCGHVGYGDSSLRQNTIYLLINDYVNDESARCIRPS